VESPKNPDIEKGVNALKNGKASGVDGLSKENIANCHPAIIVHLKRSILSTQCTLLYAYYVCRSQLTN